VSAMGEPQLKAFLVGERTEEWGQTWWTSYDLVFAPDAGRALDLWWPELAGDDPDRRAEILEGGEDYAVEHLPTADHLADRERIVPTRQADAMLRPLGWHFEDERMCQLCGEYCEDICGICELCPDCREGDCPECGPGKGGLCDG
jgi:hypothetical protein